MEAMRPEKPFGPTDPDDVNVVNASDTTDTKSYANEDVMADNETAPRVVEGADDLADTRMNGDDRGIRIFDLANDELRKSANYMRHLHDQLLALQTIIFETYMNTANVVSVPIPRPKHTFVNTEVFYSSGKQD